MKRHCKIIVLLLIAAFAAVFPLSAAAAESPSDTGSPDTGVPGMVFSCERSADGSQLTVTAYLENPGTQINAGMFLLGYDGGILSADAESVSACEGIVAVKYFEGDKCYIGADWYPSASIEPSADRTPIAVITFGVKDASASAEKTISLCADAGYLDDLGGYSGDGGVLLCTDSTHTYSAAKGTALISFDPPSYGTEPKAVQEPAEGKGFSWLPVVITVICAAGIFAAAYYLSKRSKSKKSTTE